SSDALADVRRHPAQPARGGHQGSGRANEGTMSDAPKGRRARRAERAAALALSRGRNFTADLGHGIFVRGDPPAPWRLETRDVPHLRELLGDELLSVLVRALAASNRIASLVHLERYN